MSHREPWPAIRVYFSSDEISALSNCQLILDGIPTDGPADGQWTCPAGIDYWVFDKWKCTTGMCSAHLAQLRRVRPEWIVRIETAR